MISMVDTVIFDIGGVLITGSEKITPYILSEVTGCDIERSLEVFNQEKINLQMGYKSIGNIMQILDGSNIDDIKITEMENKYVFLYLKQAVIDNEILKLINTLSYRYQIYAFSNMIGIHIRANAERGIFTDFRKCFFSSEIKYAKPDINAFNYVLQEINKKPQECLYIEDNDENLEAGRKLGLVSIKYISQMDLIGHLKKMNVL